MTKSITIKGLLASAAALAVAGAAIAQSTPPNPAAKDPAVGAGQQSTQTTPMGTTGTPGGASTAGSSGSGTTMGASGSGSTGGSASTGAGSSGSGTTAGASGTTASSDTTSASAKTSGKSSTKKKAKKAKADRN